MQRTRGGRCVLLVALPPAATDLGMLVESAGLADPLLDLRCGDADYRRWLVRSAVRADLSGITIVADLDGPALLTFLARELPDGSRVVLCSHHLDDASTGRTVADLKDRGLQVGFEVGGSQEAWVAFEAGADFMLASGKETGGPVSSKTTFVLVQELLDGPPIPLVVRGSLGPVGTAAACMAGCAGSVLDSQLLLLPESPISAEWKTVLSSASPLDTVVLGETVGRSHRLLPLRARRRYEQLVEAERDLWSSVEAADERTERFEQLLAPLREAGFSPSAELPPVGQGLAFGQRFAEQGLSLREVLDVYAMELDRAAVRLRRSFPFRREAPLARFHGVSLPIVQGPMAVVTANTRLPGAVAEHGGLPTVATSGLTAGEASKMLADARESLGGASFGAGIIAFSPDAESMADAVLAERPGFAVIAGGDVDLAARLERAGIPTYTHAPSVAHLRELLDAGLSGVVLEGHEAGGHVGGLCSLIQWEMALDELRDQPAERLQELRVLFAGGVATARASVMAAAFAAELAERGVACGLQVGTAYLATNEAVEKGAVSRGYQQALLYASDTVISGETTHRPARWADTPAARQLTETELVWQQRGDALAVRKRRSEELSHKHLEASVHGTGLPGENGAPHGPAYMCGQAVAALRDAVPMARLHSELTDVAEDLAGRQPPEAEAEGDLEDAIAIVGIGCIFPKAASPEEYWKNLLRAETAFGEIPKDRWDVEMFYDPRPGARDKSSSKLGAFVEGFEKDPIKFRIPPVAAPSIDRLQFLALEVARQALEDAGCLTGGFPHESTGVILGNSMGGELAIDYGMRVYCPKYLDALRSMPQFQKLPPEVQDALAEGVARSVLADSPELTEDSCPGTLGSVIAGRICNCFDLGGVSYTLDGACASSLAAVNAAMLGLRSGQYDMVLAGGVDGRMDPSTYILFSNLGVLSDTGCFPFQERADGFVMGEGCGMVVLKRWADARRDGDRVYALIRGVGSSSDGSAKGITAPDADGQVLAMERAYEELPFGPESVALVEAHGTATRNGDMTELESLSRVFGGAPPHSVALGSVKSMIGHLKTAAGVAGLIKVALALQKGVLPPMAQCEEPRRGIDWEKAPFRLQVQQQEWVSDASPRRGAVNSFGFGGVNFHVVLQEPPDGAAVAFSGGRTPPAPAELFVLRAPTQAGVMALATELEDRLHGEGQPNLTRLARQVREQCPGRGATLALVASTPEDLSARIAAARKALGDGSRQEYTSAQGVYYGERPMDDAAKVAFLYPGQGSQYADMAGDAGVHFPFVQQKLGEVDRIACRWTGRSILPALCVADGATDEEMRDLAEQMERTDVNHPALLAMWVAIGSFLRRAGIRPDAAAGHSVGEYGALHAAGVFDLETAVAVATTRGTKVYEHAYRSGSMAAISAPADRVAEALGEAPGLVTVANKNCPAQTVISGDVEAVEAVVRYFEGVDVRCMRLPVSSGFHSPLMSSCVEPFRQAIERAPVNRPSIPVQCNVTGRAYEDGADFARNLRDALAEHLVRPVEFAQSVESMYADGVRLFLEVGPGSTLCSFVDSVLRGRPHWTFPTNLSRTRPATQLLHALGFCAARGLRVDLDAVMPHSGGRPNLRVVRREPPRQPAPARQPRPVEARPDIVRDALNGADAETVERYLAQRRDYLGDLVRLDFQHFAGVQKQPGSGSHTDGVRNTVVSTVSRRTGYPPDVIDLDLDVEAELGLDSIKQAEIVRELEQTLAVPLASGAGAGRLRITTLRELVDRFRERVDGRSPAQSTPEALTGPQEADRGWNLNCHRMVCELRETPDAPDASKADLAGRHVLLLPDSHGVADVLARSVSDAGGIVHRLKPEKGTSGLPERVDVVLDLWSYGEDDAPGLSDCAEWWQRAGSRVRAMLLVARRLLADADREGERPLWVEVTSLGGELAARSTPRVSSLAGVGLGLSRCLFADHAEKIDVLYADFDPEMAASQVAARILAELGGRRTHSELGFREGNRFQITWRAEDAGAEEGAPPMPTGSVVLAVGGARGITASLCRRLAGRVPAHFVLVGRSALDQVDERDAEAALTFAEAREAVLEQHRAAGRRVVPREVDREAWRRVWARERALNLRALDESALSVTYRQCDVTDADAVAALVSEVRDRHGRIDLVLNGAGALVEKSIEEFEPDELVAGFRPKALGTAHLLAALGDCEAVTYVDVSSVVGRWGHKGLASYAIGHATASILVAGMRGRRPGRWLSLLYGPWLDVGMTRIGSTMERTRRSGGAFVTEKAGGDYFVAELASGGGETTSFRGRGAFGILAAGVGRRSGLMDHVTVLAVDVAEGAKVLDPARHRYVADHVIDGDALLPGAMTIEMMAQTAAALITDDLELTQVSHLDLLRPVRFPRGESREVRTRARLTARGPEGMEVSCEAFTIFRPPGTSEPQEMQHATCELRFGVRAAPPEPAIVVCQHGLGECAVDLDGFWHSAICGDRTGMFRNVRSVVCLSPDAVSGQLLAPALPECGERPLTGNPVCLDGSFYLTSWPDMFAKCNPRHYVRSIESIEFFAGDDPEEARFCRASCEDVGDHAFRNDAEVFGSLGRIRERITGLVNVRVGQGIEEAFEVDVAKDIRWNPQRVEIARLLGLPGPLSLAEVRISLVESALKARGEEQFLSAWLSPDERDRFAEFRHEKRRRDWLAGRVAAKEAVRSLLGPGVPVPSALPILTAEDGSPRVAVHLPGLSDMPFVTLAHGGDSASAAAARTVSVGIDVEPTSLEIERVAEQFCVQEEADLVGGSDEDLRVPVLMTLWVAKEAALKVVGAKACTMTGMRVEKARPQGEYTVCDLRAETGQRVRAAAFRSHNYFYAVAASAQGTDWREGQAAGGDDE